MGARFFIQSEVSNSTAEQLFAQLSNEATDEFGYDPYNGTISTTSFCGVIPGEVLYVDDDSARRAELMNRYGTKGESRAVPLLESKRRWSKKVEKKSIKLRIPAEQVVHQTQYPEQVTPALIGKYSRISEKNVKSIQRVESVVSKWDVEKSAGDAGKRQYEVRAWSEAETWTQPFVKRVGTKAEASKLLNATLQQSAHRYTNGTITPIYEPVITISRKPAEYTVTVDIEYAQRLADHEKPAQIGWAFIVGAST